MKKFLSCILSAAICAGMAVGSALSADATVYTIEPNYPIHGNKCGTIVITPELDRDVYVTITQLTEDGNYKYYDTVLPAGGEAAGEHDYTFILEGKDDVSYSMTVGVPKYKGSNEPQVYTYEFVINDTDNIVDETINGYIYSISIARNDDLEKPEMTDFTDSVKDEYNVITSSSVISFPASDVIPGDVDFNGKVDLYDVIEIAKYLMDSSYFSDEQISAGDFNGSGKVDLYDAIDIAKTLM